MQSSCSKQETVYAGFWVRLAAYLVDTVIVTVILLICQRRDWILLPGSCPIPAGKWFGTVFANKGILVFFLVSLLFFFMA